MWWFLMHQNLVRAFKSIISAYMLFCESNFLVLCHFFLCRIKEFSEWAQCLVLELVAKYVPLDSNEIFDIMNLLEDRLQHANGAVVLATIKVFLHLTLSMTDVHQQVLVYSFPSNFGYTHIHTHNRKFLYTTFDPPF